jgi:hypothetical protein
MSEWQKPDWILSPVYFSAPNIKKVQFSFSFVFGIPLIPLFSGEWKGVPEI